MRKSRFLIAVVVLAVQCLAIGWLIVRYERIVQKGTEIRFRCQAYDPYDPLRGRYLRMTVRETTKNVADWGEQYDYRNRDKYFVRVEPSTNGLWQVTAAAFTPTGDGLWVKPKSISVSYKDSVTAIFPDQLFVNEKIASEAEALLSKKMNDAVAVYRVLNGEIVLTGIEIGGKSILEQVR